MNGNHFVLAPLQNMKLLRFLKVAGYINRIKNINLRAAAPGDLSAHRDTSDLKIMEELKEHGPNKCLDKLHRAIRNPKVRPEQKTAKLEEDPNLSRLFEYLMYVLDYYEEQYYCGLKYIEEEFKCDKQSLLKSLIYQDYETYLGIVFLLMKYGGSREEAFSALTKCRQFVHFIVDFIQREVEVGNELHEEAFFVKELSSELLLRYNNQRLDCVRHISEHNDEKKGVERIEEALREVFHIFIQVRGRFRQWTFHSARDSVRERVEKMFKDLPDFRGRKFMPQIVKQGILEFFAEVLEYISIDVKQLIHEVGIYVYDAIGKVLTEFRVNSVLNFMDLHVDIISWYYKLKTVKTTVKSFSSGTVHSTVLDADDAPLRLTLSGVTSRSQRIPGRSAEDAYAQSLVEKLERNMVQIENDVSPLLSIRPTGHREEQSKTE